MQTKFKIDCTQIRYILLWTYEATFLYKKKIKNLFLMIKLNKEKSNSKEVRIVCLSVYFKFHMFRNKPLKLKLLSYRLI